MLFLVLQERAPRREIPSGLASLHPFYVFPTNVSRDVLTRYNNRLGCLHNREFAVAPTVNWQRLRDVGIVDRLTPFLIKLFVGNRYSFTCKAWNNIFAIQERVYKELCVEFLSTMTFHENIQDPTYPQALVFCLGGEYRECSLVEFSWRMGLYEAHEAMTPEFVMFL